MEIGRGLSKPVIRGLGFNRMAVTDQSINQEGHQRGADHGLEIDQLGVEETEVVKGPVPLLVGSSAIGGALTLVTVYLPVEETLLGDVALLNHSGNDYGTFRLGVKGNYWGWFGHLCCSLIS